MTLRIRWTVSEETNTDTYTHHLPVSHSISELSSNNRRLRFGVFTADRNIITTVEIKESQQNWLASSYNNQLKPTQCFSLSAHFSLSPPFTQSFPLVAIVT